MSSPRLMSVGTAADETLEDSESPVSRPFVMLASAAALALILTGCGGAAGPDGGAADPADSPLNTYMMALYGQGGEETDWEAEAIENNKLTEELVAECMTEEGFEYVPQTNNISFGSGADEYEPESEKWVSQYGYGAVNYPGRDAQPEDEPGEDPNAEYVTSLSESEQAAYNEILWGPQPSEEEMNAEEGYSPTWEQQGCFGKASHEVQGEDPMQSDEHKPVVDALQAFWQEQGEAPELSEVNAAWASCMADAGESGFSAQPDAQTSIYDELNAYYEKQTEFVEDDPKLDEIGEREITLALVDLDCREKTDYRAKAQTITFALEEQFIEDHKSELEALKADAEQGRK